jgi:hypothetical protein
MHRIPSGRALALALSVTLMGPAIAFGQASSAPAASGSASEILASMLLTANDLPAGMTSEGITDGSTFTIDTADFLIDGGLAIAEQTWSAATAGPILRVFDFRFLFPSPEAAAAYLAVAGPTLSEATSGLSEVSGDIAVGDGFRHFAGETEASEQAVALQNVFFQIGPVVAKVFVGGYGTTWADVLPIVKAAGGRILNATTGDGSSPPVPAPSAEPTTQPTPGVTAGATPEPTVEATAEVPAQPTPEATEAAPTATAEATPATSPSGVEPGGAIRQWALTASASSEYGSSGQWSAQSAAGAPDVTQYSDNQKAWTPKLEDGTTDWLDLRYDQAVIPTAVRIHESFNPGFVTKVEAYHTAEGTWATLWEGRDTTLAGGPGVFEPPLDQTIAVDRIRITVNTNVPGWNEIDAVELVGVPPG